MRAMVARARRAYLYSEAIGNGADGSFATAIPAPRVRRDLVALLAGFRAPVAPRDHRLTEPGEDLVKPRPSRPPSRLLREFLCRHSRHLHPWTEDVELLSHAFDFGPDFFIPIHLVPKHHVFRSAAEVPGRMIKGDANKHTASWKPQLRYAAICE